MSHITFLFFPVNGSYPLTPIFCLWKMQRRKVIELASKQTVLYLTKFIFSWSENEKCYTWNNKPFQSITGSHGQAEVYVKVLFFFYSGQITSYSSCSGIAMVLRSLFSVLLCSSDIELSEKEGGKWVIWFSHRYVYGFVGDGVVVEEKTYHHNWV